MAYRKLKKIKSDKKDYLLLTKTRLSKILAMMLALGPQYKYQYKTVKE